MDRERRVALQRDATLTLTQAEIAEGWLFCVCEWDGMLIHKDDVEATFCGCLNNDAETVPHD